MLRDDGVADVVDLESCLLEFGEIGPVNLVAPEARQAATSLLAEVCQMTRGCYDEPHVPVDVDEIPAPNALVGWKPVVPNGKQAPQSLARIVVLAGSQKIRDGDGTTLSDGVAHLCEQYLHQVLGLPVA